MRINSCPLSPGSFPPRPARGEGELFCGVLQAGYARLQNPLFFLPLPNGAGAVGEGAGGGAKATAHKGLSIAVKLPDARLNTYMQGRVVATVSVGDTICMSHLGYPHLSCSQRFCNLSSCAQALSEDKVLKYSIARNRWEVNRQTSRFTIPLARARSERRERGRQGI